MKMKIDYDYEAAEERMHYLDEMAEKAQHDMYEREQRLIEEEGDERTPSTNAAAHLLNKLGLNRKAWEGGVKSDGSVFDLSDARSRYKGFYKAFSDYAESKGKNTPQEKYELALEMGDMGISKVFGKDVAFFPVLREDLEDEVAASPNREPAPEKPKGQDFQVQPDLFPGYPEEDLKY